MLPISLTIIHIHDFHPFEKEAEYLAVVHSGRHHIGYRILAHAYTMAVSAALYHITARSVRIFIFLKSAVRTGQYVKCCCISFKQCYRVVTGTLVTCD